MLEILSDQFVSNKKEELGHVTEQFNIQVDNPLAVLNQDTSRNFLHSANPRAKYQVSISHEKCPKGWKKKKKKKKNKPMSTLGLGHNIW